MNDPILSSSSPRPILRAGGGGRSQLRLGASLLAVLLLAATGCRSQERSFPGESSRNVWLAARAAAESPNYDEQELDDRWIVDLNEVFVDEDAGELEVFRELSRLHIRVGGDRYRERRTWKIGISVTEEDDAPMITMVSRGLAVPAHVTEEATRYFDQVAELLSPPVSDAAGSDDVAGEPARTDPPGS